MCFNPKIDFRIFPAWGKKRRCILASETDSTGYFVNIKDGEERCAKRIDGLAIRSILAELSQCKFPFAVDCERGFDGTTYTLELRDSHSIVFEWWNFLPDDWHELKPLLVEIYCIAGWKGYPFEIA